MKKENFKTMIEELAEAHKQAVIEESLKLFKSGGIDTDAYDDQEYVLPKIVITAALDYLKDSFVPMRSDHLKTLKNLKHF